MTVAPAVLPPTTEDPAARRAVRLVIVGLAVIPGTSAGRVAVPAAHPAISTRPVVHHRETSEARVVITTWNPQDNDWRGRFHGAPWGDGLPPWGWGAPPPPIFDGPLPPAWGPPPPPINYFGFNEQPVWDPGYNQWGFWFFGIWIPLPV